MSDNIIILLKPDCKERGLEDTIIKEISSKTQIILRSYHEKSEKLTEILKAHYKEHLHKDFYDNLIREMQRGPICAIWCKGNVNEIREFCMNIREKYKMDITNNTIHCSDTPQSGDREFKLWFPFTNV